MSTSQDKDKDKDKDKLNKLKKMSDDQLIQQVEYLVRRERQLVECLIWHLQEIQDRKLYLQMGFTSLFECLVKHFKYSESSAYSRISVLRIIKDVPQVAEGLGSGELNLTNLTLAQSYIKKQEKISGHKMSIEQKTQMVTCVKNKSSDEVKQIFAQLNPTLDLPVDQTRYLDENHVQLQMTINKNILAKVEHLKSLISHSNINPSFAEILEISLDAAIEKIEKKKRIYIQSLSDKSVSFNDSSADTNDLKIEFENKNMNENKNKNMNENMNENKNKNKNKNKSNNTNNNECESKSEITNNKVIKKVSKNASIKSDGVNKIKKDNALKGAMNSMSKKDDVCKNKNNHRENNYKIIFKNENQQHNELELDSNKINSTKSTRGFAVGNLTNSRYISARNKKQVVLRSQNQCEHIFANGQRCSSKFQTQFDHVKPFCRGGNSDLQNLQLLCRVHNLQKSSF